MAPGIPNTLTYTHSILPLLVSSAGWALYPPWLGDPMLGPSGLLGNASASGGAK